MGIKFIPSNRHSLVKEPQLYCQKGEEQAPVGLLTKQVIEESNRLLYLDMVGKCGKYHITSSHKGVMLQEMECQ
jgi:hypothetical protein